MEQLEKLNAFETNVVGVTEKFEEKKRRVAKLTMKSDIFFKKVLEDKLACQDVLRILLQKEDLIVIDVNTQVTFHGMLSRDIIADVVATDSTGVIFNIEMQREDNDDHLKRVRLYSAHLDYELADKGSKFRDIKDLYCVFITEHDFIGGGKPIYHVSRIFEETGTSAANGLHEVYANLGCNDGSTISELLYYFTLANTDYYNSRFSNVIERVKYFKEDRKGVEEMDDTMKEVAKDYIKELVEEGRQEGKIEGIIKMCKEFGIPENRIIFKLQEELEITEKEAFAHLENYNHKIFKRG